VSTALDPREETDLVWFLGAGQCAFERSNFGAQLDRIANSAEVTVRCQRCDGDGCVDVGTVNARWCPRCKGIGHHARARENRVMPRHGHVRCSKCRGSGSAGGDPCLWCGGDGYVEIDPVFPTGFQFQALPQPRDAAITRYAGVSRTLARVHDASERAYAALVAYYGDQGARWALTARGRLFALYPLTQAGKKLLAGNRNAEGLRAAEQLDVLMTLDGIQSKRERRALFLLADEQAREMLSRALATWRKATAKKAELCRG